MYANWLTRKEDDFAIVTSSTLEIDFLTSRKSIGKVEIQYRIHICCDDDDPDKRKPMSYVSQCKSLRYIDCSKLMMGDHVIYWRGIH